MNLALSGESDTNLIRFSWFHQVEKILMGGKRWIVEVTQVMSDGVKLSFGSQVNYLPEMFYVPPLSINPRFDHVRELPSRLVEAINSNQIEEILIKKNVNYDPAKDDLSKPTYP